MPQSYSLHYIYFPHTEIELGLPTASYSPPFSSTPAFAPPTPACVLASQVLACHSMPGYTYSDPALIEEPKSAVSWRKKLLPKLIEKWKTVKGKGRFDTLLSKKSHRGMFERQESELPELREEMEEHEEWQSRDYDDSDSRSSWSSLSDEHIEEEHRAVWQDNNPNSMDGEDGRKHTSRDCVGERIPRLR